MTAIADRKPDDRLGFRWEYRKGCECLACPWKDKCMGKTWPHWIEVKEMTGDGGRDAG